MTRSILSGLLAVVSVTAIAALPAACSSGGIGDPCTPEDEYRPDFAGFTLTQENIESRSFQCDSRICLVNFFQGRVSCPLGQGDAQIQACAGPNDGSCPADFSCVESVVNAPDCVDDAECGGFAGVCDPNGKFCSCSTNEHCPAGFTCDTDAKQCKQYVCHDGQCQDPASDEAGNRRADGTPKACCVPGTDRPIGTSVCGQCSGDESRDAAGAVYCSCRCGVAEGEAEDENFNFCDCPDGFTCAEVRRNVGLGDKQLTGKYCVRNTDKIVESGKVSPAKAPQLCGDIVGTYNTNCSGNPT